MADVVGRVDISMIGVTTGRVGEGMTLSHAAQSATRAMVARGGRIDLSHAHAAFLRLILDASTDESTLPERHAPSQGSSSHLALFGPGDMQLLKDQSSIVRCPLDQLSRRLWGKGRGALALFAARPFHDTSDTSGILVLCLPGRMVSLETGAGFRCPAMLDLDCLATDEQCPAIGINGHQGPGFLQVDPYRQDTGRFRDFKGNSDPADHLAIPFDHHQAIKLDGLLKGGLDVLRDLRGEMFPRACSCPERPLAVRFEASITTPFPNQEPRAGSLELERSLR